MYQVNVEKIEEHLSYLERVLEKVIPVLKHEESAAEDMLTNLALERALHVALETIADVGNYLIDGFIMRDPGSYEDIVDILEDEKVIDSEMAAALKSVVNMRKKLITHYTTVDRQEVYTLLRTHSPQLQQFPARVRDYLAREL
ncbi:MULTISPECIES: type VII toxin-antitoxin system HepT family RNase toxin [Aneurinibacillus]|uniref:DUF86 domain-containing protein n=1 Tax=Aneurinibacillus thermoaerophilus TaxID=143495 RepID=A0A1G8BZY7_ANETH|nr:MULTISPECIES: DUF86 domain-containing protein [Aneurinibacillus]AMA71976.1 hypothetical protein ACH33_03385 [Aneurinibacillus sp. XH2]MED0737140.1 DUF86 domain-containing protein [Aneurinibacillus thermoaerophilus]MED0764807.1 DUF86 domain-containing protein [Aneurinibacillus thermoaerophilus]QYY42256.1 DUF86 domain-containing protein [Aneurinibacillus thermoaerophilus]SDH38270.1 Uncharacterized conserved protein YutE, UPF0331/DUF86 family [Aneurinibacillus thermoaerophilus]